MESSCAAAGTRLTRRALLKLCIATATALAMPASLGPLMAEVLATRNRRPVIWLSCCIPNRAVPVSCAAVFGRGATLFDDSCVYCHLPSRKPFRTASAEIPALLRSGNIRAHRFSFTDAQLADLAEYLKTLEK
jgi:hypothetical protein